MQIVLVSLAHILRCLSLTSVLVVIEVNVILFAALLEIDVPITLDDHCGQFSLEIRFLTSSVN